MTDNELLENFFQPAREQQLSDDGFTERVMMQLPKVQARRQKAWRLSHLWTLFCVVLGLVVLFVFVGWQTLFTDIMVSLRTLPVDYHPSALLVALLGLCWLFIAEMLQRVRQISSTLVSWEV